MKMLSLTQPWATLWVMGVKIHETRSWATNYRGAVGVHASKGFPRWARDICWKEPFLSYLGDQFTSFCPLGAVIGVVEITGCFATPGEGVAWREYFGGHRIPPDEPDRSFGDYSPGRFAWRAENPIQLSSPIPWKGALGLWSPPIELEQAILQQLPVVKG